MQHNFPNRIARIVLRFFFRLDGDPENALTGDVCHAHANRELHLPTIHFLASSSLIFSVLLHSLIRNTSHFTVYFYFAIPNRERGLGPKFGVVTRYFS